MPAVNTINFDHVFSNFFDLLAGNPVTFSVIISLLVIYFLLLVPLRRLDRKDIEKVCISPSTDNKILPPELEIKKSRILKFKKSVCLSIHLSPDGYPHGLFTLAVSGTGTGTKTGTRMNGLYGFM